MIDYVFHLGLIALVFGNFVITLIIH